jgi:hypothetical protein
MVIKLTQTDNTKRELRGHILGAVFDFPNKTIAVDVLGLKHPQVFEDVITAIVEYEEGEVI